MHYRLFVSTVLVIILVIGSNSFHTVSPKEFKKVQCQERCYVK